MKIACALSSAFVLVALLAGCQPGNEEVATVPTSNAPASTAEAKLNPLPGQGYRAGADSSHDGAACNDGRRGPDRGVPEAAPNAAQRFVELASSGFFDETPISRVVPGFVAQFGVNWRQPHKAWKNRKFNDDPTKFALERGTLAFAKAGPNTNSTQVFINYAENNRLADPRYNFTAFGKVVSGMDVVDKFVQVGDPSGGLDQERLWADGGAYGSLPSSQR